MDHQVADAAIGLFRQMVISTNPATSGPDEFLLRCEIERREWNGLKRAMHG
jgi:hypothetical protein